MENPKRVHADELSYKDFKDNTAVMFVRVGKKLYGLGATLEFGSDEMLYNSIVRVGNLTGTAQRTLFYEVGKHNGLLEEFKQRFQNQP